MRAAHVRCGRTRYIFDDALGEAPPDWVFEPRALYARNRVVERGGGRGTVLFLDSGAGDGQQWALRHYVRGGSVARVFGDRYWWTGLEETRAWREWQFTSELFDAGLPVARPVAGRVIRQGPLYTADFITVRVRDARSLDESLSEGDVDPVTWRAVGATIRRFHDAGAWHSDLNSRNILIGPEPDTVHIIDWDRGEWRPRASRDWRTANLDRLKRDFEKRLRIKERWGYTPEAYGWMLEGYGGGERRGARGEG